MPLVVQRAGGGYGSATVAQGEPDEWTQWWRCHGARELRCILMTAWDPVGAADTPEAWDEYDDYASGVATRLRTHNPDEAEAEIQAYLKHIEHDRIGVSQTRQRTVQTAYVARALTAWYEFSFKRRARPPREWTGS